MRKKVKKIDKVVKVPRFNPFLRGVIFGLFLAGYTYREIADELEKSDGSNPCFQSVASVVQTAQENGGLAWDGASGSTISDTVGRPRKTSDSLDKKILKLVFKKTRKCTRHRQIHS